MNKAPLLLQNPKSKFNLIVEVISYMAIKLNGVWQEYYTYSIDPVTIKLSVTFPVEIMYVLKANNSVYNISNASVSGGDIFDTNPNFFVSPIDPALPVKIQVFGAF